MNLLKHRSMRFYLVFFLILTMAIGGSAIAAFASSGPVSTTVSSGGLTESGTYNQSASATLNGTDQLVPYTLPIQVKDWSGSGAGWDLTISGTPLSDGVNGHPALTQSVTGASSACAGGGSCTNATSLTSPVSYPVGIGGSALRFFSADTNTGMGVINVSTTVTVSVPATAYVGTYTSNLTLAAVSGP